MNQSAVWVQFEQYRFVLGMEWRLLEPTERIDLKRLLQLGREGMQWYVASADQHFVGMCNHIPLANQPMYSAAMHLARQWSRGGVEIFVFGMPEQRVCMVGLDNYKPVPGFDFIGSMAEAQTLVDDFEAIHHGEEIRRVGDTGLLSDEEPLSVRTVFDEPTIQSKLKKTPHLQNLLIAITSVVLVVAVALGVWYQHQQAEEQAKAEALAQLPPLPPPDPNPAYNQNAHQLVQDLNGQNQSLFKAWIQLTAELPLVHQGWVLTQMECKTRNCTSTWRRQYGSVADFYNHPPPNASDTQQVATDKNALNQHLQTVHTPKLEPSKEGMRNTSDLPTKTAGFRHVSSWLQDLSLIGASGLQIEPAQPWNMPPANTPVAIKQPLFKGTWSAELPLGMAADLHVPSFVSVTYMKTALGPTFQLSGDYYVRAD